MRTYLTKTIDQRAAISPMKALIAALLVAAMAATVVPSVRADDRPDTFADLVETLSPAVVNISTVQTIERRGSGRGAPKIPEGMPFEEFWEQFRDRFDGDQEPRQARSLGSGFVIDPSGIVITNNHVVEGADEITVSFPNRDEYTAEVLGRDALSDLAVLKINHENGDDFPFVNWGNDEASRIGDWVIAIGNPFGQNGTVTAGIISARNRSLGGNDVEFIQTDASINRGNSGGPLFNMSGEVVGVNTAIFSPSGGNVGIGFSIPSNHAKSVVEQLQEYGKVRRGWLGVSIQPLTEDIAEALGLDFKDGAMVTRVEPDSPADAADLEEGDIIITWDGQPVIDNGALSRLVKRTPIGKAVDVVIMRAGERITLAVETGALPDALAGITEGEEEEDEDNDRRRNESDRELTEGMELAPLNDSLRQRFEIDEDVEGVAVLQVSRRSNAYRAGIRNGAVIVRVNQQRVDSPSDVVDIFNEAIDEGRDRVLVLINLRGNTAHVLLRLETDD